MFEEYLYIFKDEKDINKKDILDYVVDIESKTSVINDEEYDFKGKAKVIDYNIEYEPYDKRNYINVKVAIKGYITLDENTRYKASGEEWYYISFNEDYTDIREIDFCDLFENDTQTLMSECYEDIQDLLDNVINNITTNDTKLIKIDLNKQDLDRYNKLLALDLEELLPYYNKQDIEDLGAKTDDYIGILSKDIDKDYVLTIDLASGTSNYYDNVVLWKRVGDELVENYVFECEYSLGVDFEFTLENGKKCYIKWNIKD